MNNKIQSTDRQAKRKAIKFAVISALIGVALILGFNHFQYDLQRWLENNLDYIIENTWLVFLATLLFVAPVIAAALYLLVLGSRTVAKQQFPPPGYGAATNIETSTGKVAVRRGRIIQALSFIIIIAALTIPFIFTAIFLNLKNSI